MEVGEGWFRDEDLEGTLSRLRLLGGTSRVSLSRATSLSLSVSTTMGDSEISVDAVFGVVEDV